MRFFASLHRLVEKHTRDFPASAILHILFRGSRAFSPLFLFFPSISSIFLYSLSLLVSALRFTSALPTWLPSCCAALVLIYFFIITRRFAHSILPIFFKKSKKKRPDEDFRANLRVVTPWLNGLRNIFSAFMESDIY